MRKILSGIFAVALLAACLLNAAPVPAAATYSTAEVATHNSSNSCWVIFDRSVYDITNYLSIHEARYMDISPWCGTDMTEAFETKDGRGQDHRSSTYTLLENYKIGELSDVNITATTVVTTTITVTPTNASNTINKNTEIITGSSSNPYNFILPVVITLVAYWLGHFAATRQWFGESFNLPKFNLLFNSLLIISLIPSVVFGFYMILGYSFPALTEVNFNFLFWHVEGSVVFGTLVLSHLIQRLRQYAAPIKLF